MSEILTINTAENVFRTLKVDPLPLYDENYYMLKQKMPMYEDALPNPVLNNLVERMKLTMKTYSGLGLSANQCGVQVRMFVIGTDQFQFACINPEVLETSEELAKDNEGCLSFPGLFCKIERPQWIRVRYVTPEGQTVENKLEGLTARCFLHELDHLNGVRFIDRVGPVALQMARKKQAKVIKRVTRK